jgi:hypothetical protein
VKYIKHIFIIVFSFFCIGNVAIAQTDTEVSQTKFLFLSGQVYNNQSPVDSALITVTKGNVLVGKYYSAKRGKFKINLPLNEDYLVKVSYRRCYDKKININTLINDKGIKVNWSFEFNVDMIEFFPDVKNIESMQQPIAKIIYFGSQFGFDYDDQYTEPAQANMQKALKEEIAKTTPEARKEYLENLANNIDPHADDKAKEAELIAKAAEEAKRNAAIDKVRRDNELWNAANAKNNGDVATKAAAEKLKREADLKVMMDAAKNKRDAEVRAKAVRDSITRAEFAKKDVKVAPPKIDDTIDDYPDGVTEETVTEKNRTIKRTVVNSDNIKAVYQEITYSYGAVFYFKNDKSLTKEAYETDLAKTKKEVK